MANREEFQDLDQNQVFAKTFENNWTLPEFNKVLGEYVSYNYWDGNIYTEIVKRN